MLHKLVKSKLPLISPSNINNPQISGLLHGLTHSSSCQLMCREERLFLPAHLAMRVSWSFRSITWSVSPDGDDLEAM